MDILVYAKGAISGTAGGYASIISVAGIEILQRSGTYRDTTSNRMELMSVAEALRSIQETRDSTVTVFTDATYITDNVLRLSEWKRNRWQGTKGGSLANVDLWRDTEEEMSRLSASFERITKEDNNPLFEQVRNVANLMAKRGYNMIDIEHEDGRRKRR